MRIKRKRTRQYGFGRVFQRGQRWSVRFHGKEYATGSSDRGKAVELLLQLQQKAAAGTLSNGRDTLTVPELLESFLKRKKLAVGTHKTYASQARKHLNPFFGDTLLTRITTDMLTDYREQREKQPRTSQTSINRELAFLRSAMNDLAERRPKALPTLPHFPMESEKDNVRQGFIRDEDFEKKLLPELPRYLRAVSACAFYAGARRGEWLSVDVSDLNLDGLAIYLRKTKNGEPREVPIFDGPMLDLLTEELIYHDSVCPGEPALFTHNGRRLKTIRKAWASACKRAGFPGLRFHDLRRSANMGMRDCGIPEGVRMKVMGMKTPSIDRRYGIVDKENLDIAREKRSMGRAEKPLLRRVK
jgi:integrase